MLTGQLRLPGIEIGKHRLRGGRIHTIQNLMVQPPAGFETLHASLRLSFLVHAQNVAGIIPQEI